MKKRVVVAGTFDILHPGHVYLITEAMKLGEVIVVVARDNNVLSIKNRPVVIPEEQRRFMVEALKGVSRAVLGYEGSDPLRIIEELHPDFLLLGPNQKVSLEEVQKELQKRGLITEVLRLNVLYDEFPLSSSSLILQKASSIIREPES
ncbi:MAG: adenylyltransferase/cytidyltransferase family protein [Promethearchaeota archaeon]